MYIYLIIPFTVLAINQIIKFTIESIQNKKLCFDRLFNGSGGMPSSHTAFIFSLVTTIGYKETVSSPVFALALIMAVIVSYDAMGVRRQVGKHAVLLNKLNQEEKTLKEQIGHRPLEVFIGLLTGIIFSLGIIQLFF